MYDFGLTEEQFLKLTPAKFAAISDRHEHVTRQHDLRFGMVCSVIANGHGGKKGGGAFTPFDFVPKYGDEPEAKAIEPSETQSADDILRHLQAAFPPRPEPVEEEHGG